MHVSTPGLCCGKWDVKAVGYDHPREVTAPCSYKSSGPGNLIPQCRHGVSERGVLTLFHGPVAVFIDIARSWRTIVT